jgi:molecular chaperone GrpE
LEKDREEITGEEETLETEPAPGERGPEEELRELNDKYLRLYAEFDNYKKRTARDKEGLARFANESLLLEILPSIDHLEIALSHAGGEPSRSLAEGVEMTLRELLRTLEKFGLKRIEAQGKPFDPEYHHAMSRVERDDVQEGMVVEELRKGYMYNDKVLRASLVAVSQRPSGGGQAEEEAEEEQEIRINKAKGE